MSGPVVAAPGAVAVPADQGGTLNPIGYVRGLAEAACAYLSALWNTRRLPSEVQANMCNVELPCAASCPEGFGYALYHRHSFYMPVYGWAGSTWARLTCAVYNEMSDYERIGKAVLEALAPAPARSGV